MLHFARLSSTFLWIAVVLPSTVVVILYQNEQKSNTTSVPFRRVKNRWYSALDYRSFES